MGVCLSVSLRYLLGRVDWQKHSAGIKYGHISVCIHSFYLMPGVLQCQLKYLCVFSNVLHYPYVKSEPSAPQNPSFYKLLVLTFSETIPRTSQRAGDSPQLIHRETDKILTLLITSPKLFLLNKILFHMEHPSHSSQLEQTQRVLQKSGISHGSM